MATWLSTIKDWVNGAVVTEANLDEEVRDRHSAMYDVVTADAYTGTGGDARIWHGHKSGTLASRPTAAHAGRLYYATDLGAQFIDNGSRWDIVGVNTRVAEWFWDEFILSATNTISTNQLNAFMWSVNNGGGTGSLGVNNNNGASTVTLSTGTPINSIVTVSNQFNGTHYKMDQTSDRVPAYMYMRYSLNTSANDVTALWGLASGGTSTPDGIYFKVSTAGAGGTFHSITRSGGVQLDRDSGIAITTTYFDFEIYINALASITFYINGVATGAAHTTQIPSTTNLAFQHYVQNTVAGAGKSLTLDRIDWIAKR